MITFRFLQGHNGVNIVHVFEKKRERTSSYNAQSQNSSKKRIRKDALKHFVGSKVMVLRNDPSEKEVKSAHTRTSKTSSMEM